MKPELIHAKPYESKTSWCDQLQEAIRICRQNLKHRRSERSEREADRSIVDDLDHWTPPEAA